MLCGTGGWWVVVCCVVVVAWLGPVVVVGVWVVVLVEWWEVERVAYQGLVGVVLVVWVS